MRPNMAQNLLFELGLEELPFNSLQSLVDSFAMLAAREFATLNITHGEIKKFVTPRRIALLIADVAEDEPVVKGQKIRT